MPKELSKLLDELAIAGRKIEQLKSEIESRFFTKPVIKALETHFGCDWINLSYSMTAVLPVPAVHIEITLAKDEDDYENKVLAVNIPLDELELGTVPDYLRNWRIQRLKEIKEEDARKRAEWRAKLEAGREKKEKRDLKRLLKKYPQGK